MNTPNKTLSAREKSLFKRRINKEHNSNLRAGHVHVNEEHLNKTGIRGTKLYIFYFVVLVLFAVALANIIITILLLKAVNLQSDGLQSLEFVSPGQLLKFKAESEFDDVLVVSNNLLDDGEGLEISGTDGNLINLQLHGSSKSKMSLSYDDVIISNVDQFLAIDPSTGKTIFTTDYKLLKFPSEVENLRAQKMLTDTVTSPPGNDLGITSPDTGKINIIGTTGVEIKSDSLKLSARRDLHLKTNKSLLMKSSAGILLYDVLNLAKVPPRLINVPPQRLEVTYKLCVCMNGGRLFQVTNERACNEVGESNHPCLK